MDESQQKHEKELMKHHFKMSEIPYQFNRKKKEKKWQGNS